MNVYIGTSGQLSKAFVGENPTWKPNANTVAYRPLTATTTVNDQSWNNYNLTQTWWSFTTLNWVSCFYNGWSTTGYFNLTSAPKIPSGNADRTISFWGSPSGYSSSYQRWFISYGQDSSGKSMYIGTSTWWAYRVYFNGTYLTNPSAFTAWTWALITFVGNWTSKYLYVNWIQVATTTYTQSTTAVSSSYPFRLMRQNTSSSSNQQVRWYLSEVIIEDKAWTATEVENYFNDNKSKYWL